MAWALNRGLGRSARNTTCASRPMALRTAGCSKTMSRNKTLLCWTKVNLGVGLLILLGLPAESRAANYYIDFQSGSDANDGKSPAAAWQHCPGDANATSVPKSTILKGGDTVTFKGGVHYLSSIHLVFSGTTDGPVTYDGNSAGTWGIGKAVIDGENLNLDSRRYGFQVDTNVSHVAIRDFEVLHLGSVTNLSAYDTNSNPIPDSPGYGVYLRDATNILVADCFFHELGTWTNGSPANTKVTYGGGFGVYAFGVDGFTVTNCEFTRMEKGVRISPGQYGQSKSARKVNISNCDFHNYMRWFVEFSTGANNTTLDDVAVSHCTFHDFTEYDNGIWHGGGANPHTDGIILGVSDYANRNYGVVRIHSNYFFQSATNGGGTAMIFSSGMGGNVRIYNNVFVNVRHSLGSIYVQDGVRSVSGDTPLNFEFYNNSFYDARYCIMLRTLTAGSEITNGTVKIINNCLYKSDSGGAMALEVYDTSSTPTTVDYNVYLTGRGDNLIIDRTGVGSYTLDQARSAMGWELHGMQADPKYVNITSGIGLSSSLNDLHLKAGSPVSSAGTNLSGVFFVDKDDTVRPQESNWNIGAYEHGKPQPPTRLQLVSR
jgi:hypothetical protein